VKRLPIAILSAVVILGGFSLFFIEGTIRVPGYGAGNTLGNGYRQKLDRLALIFSRRCAIETEKAAYILENSGLADPGSRRTVTLHDEAAQKLREYAEAHGLKSVRLVSSDMTIAFSTSAADRIGGTADSRFSEVFEAGADEKGVFVDGTGSLVLGLRWNSGNLFLFAYPKDYIHTIFAEGGISWYENVVVLPEHVMLFNMQAGETGPADELDGTADKIRAMREGTIRIRPGESGSERLVSFRPAASGSKWIVGLAVDAGGVGITPLGIVTIVLMAVALLSLLSLVMVSTGRKKSVEEVAEETLSTGDRTRAGGRDMEEGYGPQELKVERTEVPGASTEEERIEFVGTGPVNGTEAGEEIISLDAGILSLKDVEEVRGLADIGEAEVAAAEEEEGFGSEEGTETGEEGQAEPEPAESTADSRDETREMVGVAGVAGGKPPDGFRKEEPDLTEPTERDESIEEDVLLEEGGGTSLPDLLSLAEADKNLSKDDVFVAGEGGAPVPAELGELFGEVMKSAGFSKGGVLVDRNGEFRMAASVGLRTNTKKKFMFAAGGGVARMLRSGRTLHIKGDALKSAELRKKFDRRDTSGLRSVFLSPVSSHEKSPVSPSTMKKMLKGGEDPAGIPAGITLICLKSSEDLSVREAVIKIKEINKSISELL